MLEIRRDEDIHREEGGWFSARWHFSFDHYRDPENRGIGPLRVFNDDRLVPGAVWPLHPHTDVEGITYVVEGLFRHEDNVGGGGVIEPGAVQRMTLGSGSLHSEQNASEDEPMRFLQLWILPDTPDLPPEVEQRQFTASDRTDRLLKVLGPEGGDVVKVHQDAGMWVSRLTAGAEVAHRFDDGRGGYLYLIDGQITAGDEKLSTGDAAKVFGPEGLQVTAQDGSELILVEVPLEFEPVGVWAQR
jgi:quercetin 2,3-dioxygenase